MRIKSDEEAKRYAVELRRMGLTIFDISTAVGRRKAEVCDWVRDVRDERSGPTLLRQLPLLFRFVLKTCLHQRGLAVCSMCREAKPCEQFPIDRRMGRGLHSSCLACCRANTESQRKRGRKVA